MTARDHAVAMLASLGVAAQVEETADHPAIGWRRAGLDIVTGDREGPPLICPTPLTMAADGMMLALRTIADGPAGLPYNGALLLGERARLMGLGRCGRVSPNGTCHLLDTIDGRIALSLPREDDWTLLPALFDGKPASDWDAVAREVAGRHTKTMVAGAAELGLAVAEDRIAATERWCSLSPGGAARQVSRPRVLDLSSLWAGPLAGSLLAMLGADVVKLEHASRLDGARRGHAGFYALLNARKASLTLDFHAERAALAALIRQADIVIEASRPRALAQLGIDAEAEVARGAVWIAISGHGRGAPYRIGFGDDCAVAAGLAAGMAAAWGRPLLAGDAIADPLGGIAAALAGWATWQSGRGALIDIALAGVVAHARTALGDAADIDAWQAMAQADRAPLYPLRQSPAAPSAGRDNRAPPWDC